MGVEVLLHLELAIILGGVICALVQSFELVVASCRNAEGAVCRTLGSNEGAR